MAESVVVALQQKTVYSLAGAREPKTADDLLVLDPETLVYLHSAIRRYVWPDTST